MLKLIAEDKDALFVLTSGNNSENYASSDELYECMKKFSETNKIYNKTLDEAIEDAVNSKLDTVNLVIGSFYTYGKVIDLLSTEISNKK